MDKARWVIKVSSKTGDKYDSEALNELCSGIDLLEYASNSMDFVKRGADSFAAHCPLHIDETASLFITPSKNMFHCFSCGVSGNIINWLRTFEGLNFREAVEKVSSLAGVNINHFKQCESLAYYKSVYKSLQKTQKKQEPVHRKILEPSYMDQFSNEIPQEWVDEGIRPDVMQEFGVRIDKMSNRIVYPVYDNDLNLIGVKGRTRFKNYADLKIKKYQNYQSIGTTDYFAGMKENRASIIQSGSAIIFEGINSVMKLRGWGWNTALAAETCGLNDGQILILIKMGLRDITIANDKGISLQKVREFTQKLRRFTNVYAVIDKRGLLENKMAPCDAGRTVWEQLYNERVKL